MGLLDFAELLMQGFNYSGSGDWLDEANSHDGTFNGGVEATWDGVRFTFDGVSGGGDYIHIADHPNLDSADTDFTVMVMMMFPTGEPSGNTVIVGKSSDLGVGQAGWVMWGASVGGVRTLVKDDVAAAQNVAFPTLAVDTVHVLTTRRDTTANEFHSFTDGLKGATFADTLGDMSNAQTLRIGAEGGGFNNMGGFIYALVYWMSALSDAEVVAGEAELRANLAGPVRNVMRSPRYGITRMATR